MITLEMQEKIQQGFQEEIEETKLLDCMRCGFCLPACPTYVHSNYDETQSPRGRIALMKAVRDGDIPFDGSVEESIDLCLGCRACEPACPAGVEYGSLLESARNVIQRETNAPVKEKAARKVAFDYLFQNQSAMEKVTSFVKFYQRSGLQALTRKMGILSFFPSTMKEMEKVIPRIEKSNVKKGMVYEGKSKKTKVAFFTGCLMDTMFAKTNEATINVLQELGCDVWVPENQVCCGALQGHSGELEKARENAKVNLRQFLAEDVDYIVNNAGGCGAFLSEYDHLLKDEDYELLEQAKQFSIKSIDITQLIYELGITKETLTYKQQSPVAVTYQDSCHLRNVGRVQDAPREILKSINNVHYVELEGSDHCCGSAGIYNLSQPEMSMKILDDKMEYVNETQAQILITTNPGCLLQMKLGIEREGLSDQMEAMHLIDFIDDYIL
ncbi:(Fe-S)-binding protein [Alkalibacillus haloalkaliphilus]|uniref:(Fe-S)-binding protein n=1 Tax=Alkalibacillus haloalkaliphilus TaxID=94136 RepID=UPI002935B200|nr:(Fe-S)-binding protein [Alkalibacillus haloalkaliphilus]MDV2582225.1 (Fe-S)-binding protein [Alkalibacillus haloalkaliphilus]